MRRRHEGRQQPDRDAQFRYITATVRRAQRDRQPAISVDTKKGSDQNRRVRFTRSGNDRLRLKPRPR